MIISHKRLSVRSGKTLWWVIATTLILTTILNLVFARSLFSLLISILAIIVAIGVTLLLVRSLEVVIEAQGDHLVLRVPWLYKKKISITEIVSVEVGPETSLVEGYGIRYLGKNRRGLLVGGPSLSITTSSRQILVSCDDPKLLVQTIENIIRQR